MSIYLKCPFLTRRALSADPNALTLTHSLFADCMLLGVCLMQFSRWWQYCHKDERWVTRVLVVSAAARAFGWEVDVYELWGDGRRTGE